MKKDNETRRRVPFVWSKLQGRTHPIGFAVQSQKGNCYGFISFQGKACVAVIAYHQGWISQSLDTLFAGHGDMFYSFSKQALAELEKQFTAAKEKAKRYYTAHPPKG